MVLNRRLYRLAGLDGNPHPVLDTPYESIDAAMKAAKNWCRNQGFGNSCLHGGIGVEVLTSTGDWRTIRYPSSCLNNGLSL